MKIWKCTVICLLCCSCLTGQFAVQITEFMPDPNPVVGLPDEEYVEIFNAGTLSIDPDQLQIASGGAPTALQMADTDGFSPGSYLVIRKENGLPTLTNGGDEIAIFLEDSLLTRINYTTAWYNDPERDNGGYSIELTGGDTPDCAGSWRASLDPSGGTPGRPNSVEGMRADTEPPRLIETNIGPYGITLTFDEAPVGEPGFYLLLDDEMVVTTEFIEPTRLKISRPIAPGRLYILTLLPDFTDCAGNAPTAEERFFLAIPDEVAPGDVVINEILFNPVTGGSDFVELYNCSEKNFQIEGWELENTESQTSFATRRITANRLFLPGDYLTLTPDSADILSRFPSARARLLIEQRLPTLPDDAGNITLRDATGRLIDAVDYREEFHSRLLSPYDGVSLERLRAKAAPTPENWFSAASGANFGTPTAANSQRRREVETGPEIFFLLNTTFSPDGDGVEDILEIAYAVEQPGLFASIAIFDLQGRAIRNLTRSELLGTNGTLRWDGATDDGQRARAGAYVLLVELFAPDGRTTTQKLVAVVAG